MVQRSKSVQFEISYQYYVNVISPSIIDDIIFKSCLKLSIGFQVKYLKVTTKVTKITTWRKFEGRRNTSNLYS